MGCWFENDEAVPLSEVSLNGHETRESPSGSEIRASGGSGKPTQSELLIGYCEQAELFHTADGVCYATLVIEGHGENWPLKGERFTQWLLRQFYLDTGKAPGAQALTDARATIASRAMFEGPEYPVFLRIAKHDGVLYLDLCNECWEAVEVTASGWRVVSSEAVPVKFVRRANAAPLPRPEAGGSAEALRPLLNVRGEEDFRLMVAWMVGALNPDGPYPALVLQGEQGSAKSTTVRVLRSLVDPAIEPLRSPPRDERDLAIAASGNWTPALDNLSGVRPWLSDALCRLATGGGFATRELYSDDREVIFSQKRPVILNGIDSLAAAGDLRDRALMVELPHLPPEKKRTERDFYRELEAVRPRALGALLDAVSAALSNLDRVELEELPRMADFAVWVSAAEEALPWESGEFMEAYAGNRTEAEAHSLEADSLAVAVKELMEDRKEWTGTATELHAALNELVEEDVRRSKAWPGAPNALVNRMKRIAPALREAGIEYGDERLPGGSRRRQKRLQRMDVTERPKRPAERENPADCRDGYGTARDESDRSSAGSVENIPSDGILEKDLRDDRDDRDVDSRPSSERERFAL